jgi:putative ABC transport system permease protein
VRAAIAAVLGRNYSLRILSVRELLESFAGQVRRAFAGIYVLAGLVMLVVLFGVVDTLAASVVERQRGLGAIRALGVRRLRLQQMIVLEALLLGTLGLLLAAAMGLSLGALWVSVTFPSLIGWVIDLHVPCIDLATLSALSIAVCVIAGALPARRAARLEPAVAIRYE